MDLSPVFKEMKSSKKSLLLNGIKGVAISGQPHSLKLPTCEKEGKENLTSEGEH